MLNLSPILLAMGCYVLAAVFKSDPGTHDGLLVLAGGLAGWAIPRLGDMLGSKKQTTREREGGAARDVPILILLLGALSFLLLLGLASRPARADVNDPSFGRCLSHKADGKCRLSEHFAAIVPALALDLKTGDTVAGVGAASLGICHGLTYEPTLWWASGADLCASVRVGQGQPNQYGFSLMLFAADYGAAGIGTLGTQKDGGLSWHGMLYLAPRLPIQ